MWKKNTPQGTAKGHIISSTSRSHLGLALAQRLKIIARRSFTPLAHTTLHEVYGNLLTYIQNASDLVSTKLSQIASTGYRCGTNGTARGKRHPPNPLIPHDKPEHCIIKRKCNITNDIRRISIQRNQAIPAHRLHHSHYLHQKKKRKAQAESPIPRN